MKLAWLLIRSGYSYCLILFLHHSFTLEMPIEQQRHKGVSLLSRCILKPAVDIVFRVCCLIISEVGILLSAHGRNLKEISYSLLCSAG